MDVQNWRLEQIGEAGLDAIVCFLPHHVLMLTGYRPRLGSGIALATARGEIRLAVPADEVDLARAAGAHDPVGYQSSTLERQLPLEQALSSALREIASILGPAARVGFEDLPLMTPNAYVSTLQLGAGQQSVLAAGLPRANLQPGSRLLRNLASRKTNAEIGLLRRACNLGKAAFAAAQRAIAPGRYEFEVAAAAVGALAGADSEGEAAMGDCGGGAWVMSGPNSAHADRAFAATGARRLQRGDFVLVHMNPQVRGSWSDLTRTYVLGEPDEQQRDILDTVLSARLAVRRSLRPGIPAREVDALARSVIAARGYGAAFTHQLGHGIGFSGISGLDSPSLHPLSKDVLEAGMCFNVEPSIYIDGLGGCRHCDAVALTENGIEELSPYLSSLADLVSPI